MIKYINDERGVNMKETEKLREDVLFSAIYSNSTSGIIAGEGKQTFLKYDEKPRYTEFAELDENARSTMRKLMPLYYVKERFSIDNRFGTLIL